MNTIDEEAEYDDDDDGDEDDEGDGNGDGGETAVERSKLGTIFTTILNHDE